MCPPQEWRIYLLSQAPLLLVKTESQSIQGSLWLRYQCKVDRLAETQWCKEPWLSDNPIPLYREPRWCLFSEAGPDFYWPGELLTVGEPVLLWNDLCITFKFHSSLSWACKTESKILCLFLSYQAPILLSKVKLLLANFGYPGGI